MHLAVATPVTWRLVTGIAAVEPNRNVQHFGLARSAAATHRNDDNTTCRKTLPCFPAELIVLICSHLSVQDASVLMMACARFWNSRKGV